MDDNVIHVDFRARKETEDEWEKTRLKTIEGLVSVGHLFGDDKKLMEAKAEAVVELLKAMIGEVPNVQITFRTDSDISPEAIEGIKEAIKDAALLGVEKAMVHAVNCLMERVYDLCTSKLKEGL